MGKPCERYIYMENACCLTESDTAVVGYSCNTEHAFFELKHKHCVGGEVDYSRLHPFPELVQEAASQGTPPVNRIIPTTELSRHTVKER